MREVLGGALAGAPAPGVPRGPPVLGSLPTMTGRGGPWSGARSGGGASATFRPADTTKAALDLDDFAQALVRRNLPGSDKYVSGIESGTEVFKGAGRPDAKAYSVNIG